MKYLQEFEGFNPNMKTALDMSRKISQSKFVKGLQFVASVIEDLSHLDFRAVKLNFTNRKGGRLIQEAIDELYLFKELIEKTEEGITFDDIETYGIDVKMILNNLNDPASLEYIQNDVNLQDRLDKLDYFIDFLERSVEYKEHQKKDWNDKFNSAKENM